MNRALLPSPTDFTQMHTHTHAHTRTHTHMYIHTHMPTLTRVWAVAVGVILKNWLRESQTD